MLLKGYLLISVALWLMQGRPFDQCNLPVLRATTFKPEKQINQGLPELFEQPNVTCIRQLH